MIWVPCFTSRWTSVWITWYGGGKISWRTWSLQVTGMETTHLLYPSYSYITIIHCRSSFVIIHPQSKVRTPGQRWKGRFPFVYSTRQHCFLQIIDSIMALFRVDFCGRGELADRQQKLAQMMSRLQKISEGISAGHSFSKTCTDKRSHDSCSRWLLQVLLFYFRI